HNNDREDKSDSEKYTEELEAFESDEINIINAQINNSHLIYEVLDLNSNLPQVGTSGTILKNIQDAKLHKANPAKGMGYTAGKSSINISNQKATYFTIEDNKRQKFSFSNNKKQLNVIKNEEESQEKHSFVIEQLTELELNQELTEKVKARLMNLLFKYKKAFETDKEPSGAVIQTEVDIIVNVEKPYPLLLIRLAYPAIPTAREAWKVHIKELMDLGVLRNVGNNEQV
ncbi:hypothetical protein O181_054860, partial [Austropuccinia psidii MF-1]|nr:hypothetical protein [Austropuccinia psidii MF-1]